jgi:hypothetical protein
MEQMRNHRWLALLACVAVLVCIFGCHGGDILALLYGSWNGDEVELYSSALLLGYTLEQVTLALEEHARKGSAVGTTQAGEPTELWANVGDEGPIHYVGTSVQDGDDLTATLAPAPDDPQTGYTMTVQLHADSETQLSGTMTWCRDGEDFTGPCTFEKYPD